MAQMLALLDARRLAALNREQLGRLADEQREAVDRATEGSDLLRRAADAAFENYLQPFAAGFARIKHVDLDELPVLDVVPEFRGLDLAVREVALRAVHGLAALAGGGAAGAALGAGTFAAVGAFAAASTGTAISGLSGAAATSATLAWLGGGSLAAGGGGVALGTTVLAGVVAAPVLLVLGGAVHWHGRRSYRQQSETRDALALAEEEIRPQLLRAARSTQRVCETAVVLVRLTELGLERLPGLTRVLERTLDYREFEPAERAEVATLVGLATTCAAVLAAPAVDSDGELPEQSERTLSAADALVDRLAA